MDFAAPLIHGRLIRRYKRFLADVMLDSGATVTAHCPNPGSMLGLAEPGLEVWLSQSANPKRKHKHSWELVAADGTLVGINTGHPNALVGEALASGRIGELAGYESLRHEIRYGANSRIDLLLEDKAKPACYVEVKNVHLMRRPGVAEFPDSVTARGQKHLLELANMAEAGARAVMVYLVQRGDCTQVEIAADIDPAYDEALKAVLERGVEAICYDCQVSPTAIRLNQRLPLVI